MSNEIIVVNNMSKRYGSKIIFKDVNMVIEKGQSIALIGHNGSGKSTFLKCISRLSNISSGTIQTRQALKFNYVPEHFPKNNLTVAQYVKHIGLVEGIPIQELETKSKELLNAFFMTELMHIPLKHLSRGNLQKVGVVQSILTKPDVLLLDEPLSGQDVESQNVFIPYIKEMNKQGVTIILSCHENFLVNRISNVVYKIKNTTLERMNLSEQLGEYDVLIYEKSIGNHDVGFKVASMIEKIENNHNQIKLIVQKEKSNEVIKIMGEEGFRLRGMYSESDKRII